MKRGFITAITIITTVCLIGITVTQFLWVNRIISLRTNQFNHTVQYMLLNVVRNVADFCEETDYNYDTDSCNIPQLPVFIDSVLLEEIGCLSKEKIEWAIIDTSKNEIIFGHYDDNYTHNLLETEHQRTAKQIFKNNPEYNIALFFPYEKQLIIRRMLLWLLILSGIFMLIVVASFLLIIHAIVNQKNISEMKNDFINNMTHEFKTPISTISVASEMLMKPEIHESIEKTQKYANIIFDENLRLRNQVEQALNINLLDKNELTFKKNPVDIHRIIENSTDIFNILLRDNKSKINLTLNATKTIIYGDEIHLINVISNLLDNAIKYASDKVIEINIETKDYDNGIVIAVSDNGIGISPDNLKHIFKKFYRVHTGDTHDVKGFGLGLFYVKTVIDIHKGNIKVKTELKKGSTFEIYLPYNSSSIK